MDVVRITDLHDTTLLAGIEDTEEQLIYAEHDAYYNNINLDNWDQQELYLRRGSLRQRLEKYKNEWSRRLKFCTLPVTPNAA